MRTRLALGLAALACAAPATAAATVHLRSSAAATAALPPPRTVVASGQATATLLSGRAPAGGWLGAIAP
jgi:hypothetical protein